MLERRALDRWGSGDPGGFLELYAPDISYFDPVTALRIDGHQAMVDYYAPFVGKIRVPRYEMLNPSRHGRRQHGFALLQPGQLHPKQEGGESIGTRWNSTVVYRREGKTWKAIHSHWSFTQHSAFQTMSPQASEGVA